MKIKGSQGRPRVEWVKAEHPLTAISDKSEVYANHNEAQDAALRRRSSACLVALFTSGNKGVRAPLSTATESLCQAGRGAATSIECAKANS